MARNCDSHVFSGGIGGIGGGFRALLALSAWNLIAAGRYSGVTKKTNCCPAPPTNIIFPPTPMTSPFTDSLKSQVQLFTTFSP